LLIVKNFKAYFFSLLLLLLNFLHNPGEIIFFALFPETEKSPKFPYEIFEKKVFINLHFGFEWQLAE